jgi:hypothetical protein
MKLEQQKMEAPSKALQAKRQAWIEDEGNLDKPMRDFLLLVQKLANEPTALGVGFVLGLIFRR